MPRYDDLVKQIDEISDLKEKAILKGIGQDYVVLLDEVMKDFVTAMTRLDRMKVSELDTLDRELVIAREIQDMLTTFVNGAVGTKLPEQLLDTAQFGYASEVWLTTMSLKASLPYMSVFDDYMTSLFKYGVNADNYSALMYKNRVGVAKTIEQVLIKGIVRGDSNQKLGVTIREEVGVSYRHAQTIARTEAGRLRSMGNVEKQRQSKQMGFFEQKRWFSIKDMRTRKDHQHLDGQTIPIGDKYEVNGLFAMAPRLFGVAKEDINCRCRSHSVSHVEDVPQHMWDSVKQVRVPYAPYNEWIKTQ
ncbi:gp4 [Listeria phage P35]|uniref:Phage capsid morphogenesis domain-containing protein n=1 Tax=Listeria phage LP-083-1 TaxID=1458854 RepID=A0A059T6G0_9CAUD|nr:minor head protein [Listeria phage P35]AAY53189.1 gp4 [Listeria phage P35]AHL18969.1 phage capsid morphogenesis domain-containing protein [Listeria phage LP-083-1]